MEDRHIKQLATWLKNNLDIEEGMPLIFDDSMQAKLEIELKGE